MPVSLIILAAGQGKRMKSDLPKVLHPLGGVPMLVHAMDCAAAVRPERVVVVAGHRAEAVETAACAHDPGAIVVRQQERLGTAHAVLQARGALADLAGDVVVLMGDTIFFRRGIVEELLSMRRSHDVVFLGFDTPNPGCYGRLVMKDGELERIVEFAEATEAERQIALCNAGVVVADRETLFSLLDEVRNGNSASEYYLPDILDIARGRGFSVGALICSDSEIQGVNTREELAEAERKLQAGLRAGALRNGVTMTAPETVILAHDTVIGRDSVIEPHVVFGPGVTVESGVAIRAFSHLEGCHIARGSVVGPHARLRPGAELAENARVGNFVEIKNARVDEGARIGHLSYIGDASVGAAANIGAGTVTCNYDGVTKHRTEIGARAFIGSDTMLVAPVTIGDEAMTASGSVITRDVPAGALGIGRARQETRPGLARKLFAKLRTAGSARKGNR